MAEIRAFVAHSFLAKDKPLVEKFLDFWMATRQVLPDFSWDHAKDAKPIPVSQKVLELMEGKNLLISICTSNELAITANAVKNLPFFGFAPRNSFEEKVSDWIIQEIGVAIGRDMKIIVLLQKGVRVPPVVCLAIWNILSSLPKAWKSVSRSCFGCQEQWFRKTELSRLSSNLSSSHRRNRRPTLAVTKIGNQSRVGS